MDKTAEEALSQYTPSFLFETKNFVVIDAEECGLPGIAKNCTLLFQRLLDLGFRPICLGPSGRVICEKL